MVNQRIHGFHATNKHIQWVPPSEALGFNQVLQPTKKKIRRAEGPPPPRRRTGCPRRSAVQSFRPRPSQPVQRATGDAGWLVPNETPRPGRGVGLNIDETHLGEIILGM